MKKEELIKEFRKKKYRFFGDSSVQVCEWNKKALRGPGQCYKQDFYGAHCLSCHQITPVTFWCNNACVFCWRPKEYMQGRPLKPSEPKKIVEALRSERKILLIGFRGNKSIPKERFEEALQAKHWAISLIGEPTLYKKLPELIKMLKELQETETVFLVSNGQNPETILKLWEKKALPTQSYVSMVAPNEKLYRRITQNHEPKGWKNYLKTLAMLKLLPCRTVIRLTHIKGLNDSKALAKEFAELLETIQSDFVEVKAYMWLGFSRKRLKKSSMPLYEDVSNFAGQLLKEMPSYKKEAEKKESRIVLLKNKKSRFKTKIIDRN